MSIRRMAALLAGLWWIATLANAASTTTLRIKVLDSETRSVSLGDSSIPVNCDQVSFDAYCRSSRTAILTNTLLVQEGNQPPFRIACNIDSKFSRCIPLPKGETFDAKREKNGITVYYVDDKGKARKQLYTLVASDAKEGPPSPAVAVATQPGAASRAATQARPATAPAPAPPATVRDVQAEKVRCTFSTTPSGAEITLDGEYVGNTPSEIAVSPGAHAVVFSMTGFSQWKRDLDVIGGSQLTVSAILEKQ